MLLARALGPGRVTGVALPSPYSSAGSLRDAAELALDHLGREVEVTPL